jgi:autotransporter-associated beta strand protein
MDTAGFDVTIASSLANATNATGTLTKQGNGLLNLSASNSYTGATTINGGVLEFSGANSAANSSAINVGINGTVRFSGGGTRGNTISGMGNLEKTGSNNLTLTASNTYIGITTVSAGTLVVTNSTLTATISNNSTLVNFATPPTVGTTNNVLSGPLNSASLASNKVTGLPPNSGWTFTNNPNLQVIVTSAGPTFNSLYGQGNENEPGSNGLTYLMNYALGGTGPSSNPALPVLTSDGTSLTLRANIRNSGQGVNVVGEYTYDLAGTWTEVELTVVTGANPALDNTTVKSFSIDVESGRPKKFMRLKAKTGN